VAYSAEQWQRAKDLFESGQYSLSEISSKVGIDKSSISKKAKIQQWQSGRNADYIEAKELIAVKKSTENQQTVELLDEIANDKIRHKQLINSNAELIASKVPMMLEQIDTPSDLKLLAETNDRLAITLKVADRHAPKIEVNNANNQQTNIIQKRVSIVRRDS
jgi:transposase-like protein